jgi:hypothetical protein
VTGEAPGLQRLEIPAGPAGRYRLAQLDGYTGLPRRAFPHKSPLILSLRARASHPSIPGTWGFGFWNDPFGLSLGFGGGSRLPVLPQAAWFFFASPPNYLSLRDDLPAQGGMAAAFHSRAIPTPLLAFGLPGLPLLALPATARRLRQLGRRFVRQDAAPLTILTTEWHTYQIDWGEVSVSFRVDGEIVLDTRVVPSAPLGLVIWVDNQYAAWPPDGRLRFGTLATPAPAWIEVGEVSLLDNP